MNSLLSKGIFLKSFVVKNESLLYLSLRSKYLSEAFRPTRNYLYCIPYRFCSTSNVPPELASKGNLKFYEYADWLPFMWYRRPKTDIYANSGDLVKELEYDPTWPKPDFELSEELEMASDEIKAIFSLATASKAEIKEVVKRRTLRRVQQHPNDFDSLEVQIALKTLQVRSLFEHSRQYRKETLGSRVLLHAMINKRNRLLKQLRKIDMDRFNWLLKELKLEYTPAPLGGHKEKYTRRWDLTRLTREYCEKTIQNHKNAYHEELKKLQADFLKEKEEALAWIEKEEKELAQISFK